MDEALQAIDKRIKASPVILFMKGTPQFPMCGFSMQAVGALRGVGVSFDHVNVLEETEVRRNLPKYADWPTFPQLYINGELIGGSDIVVDMGASGELQRRCQAAVSQ